MGDLMVVVDDDRIGRMLPSMLLRPYGIEVIECDNAEDALRVLSVHKTKYVLIDVSMPDVSGLELVAKICQQPMRAYMKLIAYTADASLELNFEYKKYGFDACLLKPISVDDLLSSIGM